MSPDASPRPRAGVALPLSSFQGPIGELIAQRMLSAPSRPGVLATLDRFEILRVLGQGGMGVVLLGRDPDALILAGAHPGDPEASEFLCSVQRHLPHIPLILLLSGTTVTWAHHALQTGDRNGAKIGLLLTILLGLMFTSIQAYEYNHILSEHLFFNPDSIGGQLYGSSFFMATGFHGFHVIIGTIFLTVCLIRLMNGAFTPKQHFGFEAAAWYWHFVDVVWLFLFSFLYVIFGSGWGH